jgi:hypothetical protein
MDGRSCEVNEVDVCIRTAGGIKFVAKYDWDEVGADIDIGIEEIVVRVDDSVLICACFDV